MEERGQGQHSAAVAAAEAVAALPMTAIAPPQRCHESREDSDPQWDYGRGGRKENVRTSPRGEDPSG